MPSPKGALNQLRLLRELEDAAANFYRAYGNTVVNPYLRDRSSIDPELFEQALSEDWPLSLERRGRIDLSEVLPLLDSAAQSWQTPGPMTLYRGISDHPRLARWARNARKGSMLVDRGYLSSSTKPGIAHEFARSWYETPGVLLQIHAPEGTRGIDMSQVGYGDELGQKEVVLPRRTALRVLGRPSFDRKLGGPGALTLDVAPE